MKKLLRCKLGFHHWHYDCKAEFPYLFVEIKCFYCGKEDLVIGLTLKEWFNFSLAYAYDKHNPVLRSILTNQGGGEGGADA